MSSLYEEKNKLEREREQNLEEIKKVVIKVKTDDEIKKDRETEINDEKIKKDNGIEKDKEIGKDDEKNFNEGNEKNDVNEDDIEIKSDKLQLFCGFDGTSYKCESCCYNTPSKNNFGKHLKTLKHIKLEINYVLPLKFRRPIKGKFKLLIEYGKLSDGTDDKTNIIAYYDEKTEYFICNKCKFKSKAEKDYTMHLKTFKHTMEKSEYKEYLTDSHIKGLLTGSNTELALFEILKQLNFEEIINSATSGNTFDFLLNIKTKIFIGEFR